MAKDYIEDMENDTKYPLDYTWKSVNNFVFNPDVTFEDMQALCLGLASELERRPTKRASDVCHVCGAKLPALTQICVVCGTRA